VLALVVSGVAAVSALATPPTVLPTFAGCLGTTPKVRPRSIVVACGDGNFYLTKLKWSLWTVKSGLGAGVGHQNDCIPYCARGHFHSYSVSVTVSRPVNCKKDRLEFTRLAYRFVGRKPAGAARSGRVPFRCH
jgi:hypothetical protein